MADNWNKAGFFSGITEDYSNYHWYKGEKENPYKVILFTLWLLLFGSMRRSFIIPTWMLATQKSL